MAKAVKLADIAEQVGVSTVTVSKALSGQKGVSEEMREKIKNLAEELGYRSPSETKRQSAEKQYNIGVLIQEVYLDKYDSFYWKMYQEGSFPWVFYAARKYFKGECAGKPDAASASGKKGGWSDYSRRYDKAVH